MSAPYSLDDVARTSDEAAVRARFDSATLIALRVLSVLFALIGFPHLVEARAVFRVFLGLIATLLAAVVFVLLRRKASNAVAQFIRRRPRETAIGFILIEAACLIVYNASKGSEPALVFSIVIPMMAILLRLLPAETLFLYASLEGISAITLLIFPIRKMGTAEALIPTFMTTATCLGVSLFFSRRRRRSIVMEWTERRQSAREQIRMRDELLYAREMQLSMLPDCAPSLAWADICSISIPATEVGGDYYDYFVDGDCVALVCGDVSGHGMASGLVLSAVRGGFALLRETLQNPSTVLSRLHDVVTQTTRRRMLVTISLVLIDSARHRVKIASAGHPPVIVRRAGGSVMTIDLYTTPLGVKLPLNIPQREIDIAAGDVLVLHSDGIYETRNANDEVYGLDRLQEVIRTRGGESAETLRDAILGDLAAFRGSVEQDDDVTIVVCRMTA